MKNVTNERCTQQCKIRSYSFLAIVSVVLVCFLVLAGCAHQVKEVSHYEPGRYEDGPPVDAPEEVKNIPAMLRDAEEELKKANDAHERGDFEGAFRHYQRMLYLILEADLDSSLYYESSEQFKEILEFYLRHAHLYHHPERRIGASYTGKLNDVAIPFPLPQPVLDEIDELKNSYPNTFQRGLNRSARYMPYIQEEFRKAGVPEDLAWLAMVESMFQTSVVSHAGAGGMWQFMRPTGRRFHLRQDRYVDERYNWHSATRAAAEYLKCLHDFFDGDWALAITAYNMGEGGLDRAIKATNGERCLWTLMNTYPASQRMKQESKKFYPRLLAYIIVANAPEQYGFSYEPEPYEDVLRVPVDGGYYLADLEDAMGFSRGTLARLNPDLLQEVTPSQGAYSVAVPRQHQERFLAALQSANKVRHAGTHRVRRGETVSQIAQRYGVCHNELMRVNNVRSARALQVNQVLQVPDSGLGRGGAQLASSPAAPSSSATSTPPPAASRERTGPEATYTVKSGDTLYDIARAHNVRVGDLQKLNNIGSGGHIRVGQRLKLGIPAQPQPGSPRYHEVKPGEYPGIIAQLYGVKTSDLLAWNDLTPQSVIRSGDRLVIAGVAATGTRADTPAPTADAAPQQIKHKVAPGESASTIASRYGVKTSDLLASNNLTAKSIIRVGQTLTVNNAARNTARRDRSADIQVSLAQPRKVVHEVTAGQNPTTIARRYGVRVQDLFKWNDWSDRHVLRIGDKVDIYQD